MKSIISGIHKFWEEQKKIFPVSTIIILFILWILLVEINRIVFIPLKLDVPNLFPISVIYQTGFHKSGFKYLLFFIGILSILLWNTNKKNEFLLIAGCGLLIILGNLLQGNTDIAFIQPFDRGHFQYYQDAIQVPQNWLSWLAEFNSKQALLGVHSRTHPPFAILIHNLFLFLSSNRLPVLAVVFSLISMATIPILWIILRINGINFQKRKLILLLFAVIPAVNIYSIVSLDGIIMSTSTLFLLGLVILIKKPKYKIIGLLVMASGLILTNLLSYGGLFLIGFGSLFGVYDYFKHKGTLFLKGLLISFLLFSVTIFLLKVGFNYDHLQGFLTASKLENPDGFRLFSDPINFLLTRFEDVSEIAFFLSFGVLATLMNLKFLTIPKNLDNMTYYQSIPFMGVIILSFMFLSGAYRTGETARACLFIYPILILALVDLEEKRLKGLILLAAVQTVIMQIFTNFFW